MYTLDKSPSILLFLTFGQSFLSVVESTELGVCSFPDGTYTENFVPCSPTQDGSCCQNGDLCTQYGYCVSQSKGYHYRGACTDGSWRNPSCPDYCLGTRPGNVTYVNVIACNAASSDGTWCCAYDGDCCSSSSTFIPEFGTMFAAANAAPTSSASPSTSLTSSITTTSSSLTSSTSPSHTTSPVDAAAGSSSSSSSPSAMPFGSSSSSSHTATIVGVVVGIFLGLAALAGMFLFYRERKKRLTSEAKFFDMKKSNEGSVSPRGTASRGAMVSPREDTEGLESTVQPVPRMMNLHELNGLEAHELGGP